MKKINPNDLVIIFLFTFFSQISFSQIHHYETIIYNTDTWKYKLGTTSPSSSWKLTTFNDSAWQSGQGGIGYGDNDDGTIITSTPSIYLRKIFNVVDKTAIEKAILHADYDDSFVAYLNGIEVARANIIGNPPANYSEATALHEAVMYQGGLPEVFWIDTSILNSVLQNGTNVLAVQVHNYDGIQSSDLTSNFFLSFGINDTSNYYGATPDWFGDPSFSSSLPIVKIQTNGFYIPDEPAIQGTMGIIWNGVGTTNFSDSIANEFLGNITIERRGQTSQFLFPKNGYAVETKDSIWEDKDVSFLNFPSEEDWVLHGPYSDKTLMRNVLSMHLANLFDQYSSRTRLVELVVNDNYEGIYVLMEKIKRDENRVDIAKLKTEDIAGTELTGGYIFKLDKGEFDWESDFDMVNNNLKLRFSYVYPKRANIQPQQETYIQSFVDSFEYALMSPDLHYGGKRYDEYIDLPSFADHFIIQELSKNVDAYRISTYFHKKKNSYGGKIHAGPVWDFNLAWGNADYCNSDTEWGLVYDEHCGIFNPFWWGVMFQDSVFTNLVKCRWNEMRSGALQLDSLNAFIDSKSDMLIPEVDKNFERWNILSEYVWPNPMVTGSFQGEVDFLKNFLADRMAWMDANLFGTCEVTDVKNVFVNRLLRVFPNPIFDEANIEFEIPQSSPILIQVFNTKGQLIETLLDKKIETGEHQILWNPKSLLSGVYFLKISSPTFLSHMKVVIAR